MFATPAFAQTAAGAPTGGPQDLLIQFLPLVGLVVLFYFLMIRPQQRKEKERLRMIAELRAGQRVIFAGGLIGTIVEARQATFVVEIAPKVSVEVARGAVSRVLKDGEAATLDEAK